MTNPNIKIIKGLKPGPIIGIMAITHGDETAGLMAQVFLEDYFATHTLASGEIWLIQGNVEANKLGRRCIKHDMNRLFLTDEDPDLKNIDRDSYDYRRTRELMPVLAKLDYLFDVHNTTRPAEPFSLCMSETNKHKKLAQGFPVAFYSYGFKGRIKGTTCEWVDQSGGIGVAVECGYQHDPNIGKIAIACCKSFLGNVGVEDFRSDVSGTQQVLEIVGHERVADKESFNYTREFKNFDVIAPKEVIARDNQREYLAPDKNNLVIVFPVSIKSVREGSNREAYFLGAFRHH